MDGWMEKKKMVGGQKKNGWWIEKKWMVGCINKN